MIKAKFKDTPLEEFVDLPLKDFPNYKINKLGQVKSVSHRRILKQLNLPGDYPRVTIYGKDNNGSNRRYTVGVHILLGITFLDKEKDEDTIIDHIDGNKQNYNLDNLRYTNYSENRINQVNRSSSSKNKRFIRIDSSGNERMFSRQELIDQGYSTIKVRKAIRDGGKYKNYSWKIIDLFVQEYYNNLSEDVRKSEIWRDLSELYKVDPGKAFISSLGVIRYKNSDTTLGATAVRGYRIFDAFGIRRPVHVLVAEFFIENQTIDSSKLIVDHLDNNVNNNVVSNLSVGTQKDNINNIITKNKIKRSKTINKSTYREIDIYDFSGKFIKSFESTKEAANILKCETSTLNMCVRGVKLTIRGYIAIEKGDLELLKRKIEGLENLKQEKPSSYQALLTRRKINLEDKNQTNKTNENSTNI